jgi:hypothetical protein
MRAESPSESVAPPNRVLVVSIPKAGTYLVAEVLKALGYRSTGMHLAETAYSDYHGADLDEARRNPVRFARSELLSQSLMRIAVGQFAVGHLTCKEEIVQATASFKRIYLTRNLRTALISYMRFLTATERLGAKDSSWYAIANPQPRIVDFLRTSAPILLGRLYKDLAGWSQVSGVLHVHFEDLMHEQEMAPRVIQSIAAFLGLTACDAWRVLSSSLASDTITKSEGLTQLADYWSPEAERQFNAIGGAELNDRLGCRPSPAISLESQASEEMPSADPRR